MAKKKTPLIPPDPKPLWLSTKELLARLGALTEYDYKLPEVQKIMWELWERSDEC